MSGTGPVASLPDGRRVLAPNPAHPCGQGPPEYGDGAPAAEPEGVCRTSWHWLLTWAAAAPFPPFLNLGDRLHRGVASIKCPHKRTGNDLKFKLRPRRVLTEKTTSRRGPWNITYDGLWWARGGEERAGEVLEGKSPCRGLAGPTHPTMCFPMAGELRVLFFVFIGFKKLRLMFDDT